jgi:hypothetical protein
VESIVTSHGSRDIDGHSLGKWWWNTSRLARLYDFTWSCMLEGDILRVYQLAISTYLQETKDFMLDNLKTLCPGKCSKSKPTWHDNEKKVLFQAFLKSWLLIVFG